MVAAVGIAAIALTGCSEDAPEAGTVDDPTAQSETTEPTEEPTEDPTDSETTEAEPTDEPTDVEDEEGQLGPDEVDPDLATEAEVFVQDFLAKYDEAAGSGDFAPVTELYTETCGVCQNYVSSFRSVYEDGGRIEGGGFTDPSFTIVGGTADSVVIEVQSTIAPFEVIDADGETVDSSSAEPSTDQFRVQKDADGNWLVIGWTA